MLSRTFASGIPAFMKEHIPGVSKRVNLHRSDKVCVNAFNRHIQLMENQKQADINKDSEELEYMTAQNMIIQKEKEKRNQQLIDNNQFNKHLMNENVG